MVHSCCVIGCTARWSDSDKGFFRIPSEKEPEKRQRWLQSIRRADPNDQSKSWSPSSGDRVCKAHFLTGNSKSVALVVEDGDFSFCEKNACYICEFVCTFS